MFVTCSDCGDLYAAYHGKYCYSCAQRRVGSGEWLGDPTAENCADPAVHPPWCNCAVGVEIDSEGKGDLPLL